MKAAFFDVDGTLTKKPIWEGLLKYSRMRGAINFGAIAFWIYLTPLLFMYKLGLLPQTGFRKPWAQHLPWYFRGMGVVEAEKMWDWIDNSFISEVIREDSMKIVRQHLEDGDLVILISASPLPIVKRIGNNYGVKHVVATIPRIKNEKYSGGIDGEVCIGDAKVKLLNEYLDSNRLIVNFEESYAYADSPGDVALLEMVGNPVAMHADDDLAKIAIAKGWEQFPSK